MKYTKIIFLIFFMASFGFLKSDERIIVKNEISDEKMVVKREIVTDTRFIIADAVSIISYLSSCSKAHQKYLDTHDHELSVSCKDCGKEFIELGKFEGGLVGRGLKDLIDGKDNFKETQTLLDTYLKLLSSGSDSEILAFMAQTLNDQEYVCYGCKGTSWEPKIIE